MASVAGLTLVDVEELPTHGGSLRLWLAPEAAGRQPTSSVADVRAKEQAAALESLEAWADFQCRAQAAKNSLLRFLLSERERLAAACWATAQLRKATH